MNDMPEYWSPEFFKKGEKVMYGEFKATIVSHYSEGMLEIRMPSGVACVTGAHLVRL